MKTHHKTTRRDAAARCAALCCVVGLAGCNERSTQELAATVESETQIRIGKIFYNKIDILWVIDNSSSMCDAQAALRPALADFVKELTLIGDDFHLAVVTTDMRAPTQAGRFQNTPNASCQLDLDLSQCPDADSDEPLPLIIKSADPRYRRLDGNPDVDKLARDFNCNAAVGAEGSGFEMGLEAARAALDEPLRAGHNGGFLRDDAYLAVFFVSNENDCSDGGRLDKSDDGACEWSAEELVPVQEYVDFFTDLKGGDSSRVFMGGIIAPDLGLRYAPGQPLQPSCTSERGQGYAGYRYEQLIDAFHSSGKANICASDFHQAFVGLGSTLLPAYDGPCLPTPPICEVAGEGEHRACGPLEVRVELDRTDFVQDLPGRACHAVPHSTRRRCVLVEGEDYFLTAGDDICPSGSQITNRLNLLFDDELIIRYRPSLDQGGEPDE